jgi:hypothetical protein
MASLPIPLFVTANLNIKLPVAIAADINTHWMKQRIGSPGLLANPVASSDSTITLTLESAGAVGLMGVAAGATIVVENEAMVVTAVDAGVITVTRNVGPMAAGQAPPTHPAGITAYVLKYSDPWTMIADEALRPWAQKIVTDLGASSATFGASATGSLTT